MWDAICAPVIIMASVLALRNKFPNGYRHGIVRTASETDKMLFRSCIVFVERPTTSLSMFLPNFPKLTIIMYA